MIYRIKGLEQYFGDRKILGIDKLDIPDGKIISLSGPNGAGKTTLLNILSFLKKPSNGEIFFKNSIVNWRNNSLLNMRRKVVLLDQHPIMFTTTVFKNVEYGLKIRKLSKNERINKVNNALDLVGMRDFSDEPASNLSGGEKQRIALARVMALEPEVLICDEPVSNVDVENQSIVMNILKQINQERKTGIIFTSHNRLNSFSIAHETFFMDRGNILEHSGDNHFSASVFEKESEKYCKITDNFAFRYYGKETGIVRILLDPLKIKIDENIGNIEGKVVQTNLENDMVRIVVNTEINISVLIKQQDPILKNIFPGKKVFLIIPEDSVKNIGN